MADRLNKYLAERLGISRREADDYIAADKVTINGKPAKLGSRVEAGDSVKVGDTTIQTAVDYKYLEFHKPVGYVCSRRAQGNAPTIYQLLPQQYRDLKTVGRLDKDSSGLLLLTNDGEFTQQMTHPSYHKVKLYEITLDQPLQPLHRQMISDYGVQLEDGVSKFELERLTDGDDTNWRITMSEGRNRQIRRTFAALGYTVTRLYRTRFGKYDIDKLASGAWRETEKR